MKTDNNKMQSKIKQKRLRLTLDKIIIWLEKHSDIRVISEMPVRKLVLCDSEVSRLISELLNSDFYTARKQRPLYATSSKPILYHELRDAGRIIN